MTDKELADNVVKLRQAMKGNPDFDSRTEPDMVGDFRLQRFLISRGNDLEKAKTMLEDHLKWRKEHKIEDIRKHVIDKPYLVGSFPYAKELAEVGMGMGYVAVHCGFCRLGDVVHVEQLQGSKQVEGAAKGKAEEYVDKLFDHYYGFFERRSILLEELSVRDKRMVRGVQLRDVSKLSLMPQGGVFPIVRKILKSGLDNYPESASVVFFIDAPAMFSAIFAIVRVWLPEDTKKKLHFISGEGVPEELMRYVRPSAIAALRRVQDLENGDDICNDCNSSTPTKAWTKVVERSVGARHAHSLYFAMSRNGTTKVSWSLQNAQEDTKAIVHATLLYVSEDQKVGVEPDKVTVLKQAFPNVTSVSLPSDVSEALVMLHLDNSPSWLMSHKFDIKVEGS
jgi:hypothetical protein